MQAGGRWGDVCILNISSRGLLLHSAEPPRTGSYLEIRRGQHVMVARVVWSEASRFGVHTQDRLAVEAIVRDLPAVSDRSEGSGFVERRRLPRMGDRHEQSRLAGRWLEYAAFAIGGMIAASSAYGAVSMAMARPMAELSEALR
jgi:hypothetical protein